MEEWIVNMRAAIDEEKKEEVEQFAKLYEETSIKVNILIV